MKEFQNCQELVVEVEAHFPRAMNRLKEMAQARNWKLETMDFPYWWSLLCELAEEVEDSERVLSAYLRQVADRIPG